MSGTIYVVRHGETYWNKSGITHGQFDIPLNETGKHQAIMAASELMYEKFDVCFCSPLQRAVYTAKEILKYHKDLPVFYDDRLLEIYKGDFEGTINQSKYLLQNENLETLQKHGVESKAHFYKRVKSFYDDVIKQYKNKNILIVAHSGTIKMSLFYFNPPQDKNILEAWYDYSVKNCSIWKFENKISVEKPILIEYNVDKRRYPLI